MLIGLPTLACRQTQIDPAESRRWLEQDLARVAALRRAVDAEPFTVEAVQEALGGAPFAERDLGFGARSVLFSLGGGHASANVVLFAAPAEEGHAVARMEIVQTIGFDTPPGVAWEIGRAWLWYPVEASERCFRIERADPELDSALRARVAAELGAAPEVEPPAQLAGAFRRLLDPLATTQVGQVCGYTGIPPNGRLESDALVAAGRFDLLRAVLRSPNPEARVYAAHALMGHGALAEADSAAIAKLAALPMQLATCRGCELAFLDWAGALRVLDQKW